MSLLQQTTGEDAPQPRTTGEAMTVCLRETFALLSDVGLATGPDMEKTLRALERAAASGLPGDILEMLVRIQGVDEEFVPAEASRVANAIAKIVYPALPVVPFASRMMTPAMFYASFPQVLTMAKMLMAPVIYAEDLDAIGVAAFNPVAARIMAEEVVSAVHARNGVRPFVTTVRMEFDPWTLLTRKQFSL